MLLYNYIVSFKSRFLNGKKNSVLISLYSHINQKAAINMLSLDNKRTRFSIDVPNYFSKKLTWFI
ncbi:MAG: hypothetical protein DI538_04970 [Azospira oryzae]|nr:MAG: hypothetical protein DI538_04970 [Azospira oryzae]